MKISMSVMIILTTLFCVIPFAWFIPIGKINTRKKEKQFKDAIRDDHLSFNTKEQWNNNFIAIDESKKILMFIKLMNKETFILKIDLNQIKSCQINRQTRDFKKEKKIATELQSLDVEVTFLTKEEFVTLNFYNIKDEFSEAFELKRTEKWQALIQQSKLNIRLTKCAA